MAKIERLSFHVFLCRKFAVFVEKTQLFAPSIFLPHDVAVSINNDQ